MYKQNPNLITVSTRLSKKTEVSKKGEVVVVKLGQ